MTYHITFINHVPITWTNRRTCSCAAGGPTAGTASGVNKTVALHVISLATKPPPSIPVRLRKSPLIIRAIFHKNIMSANNDMLRIVRIVVDCTRASKNAAAASTAKSAHPPREGADGGARRGAVPRGHPGQYRADCVRFFRSRNRPERFVSDIFSAVGLY